LYDVLVGGTLAALRPNLEMVPSPLPDRPGLLLRDPFRYSEIVLVIPPPVVPCLAFFNGRYEESQVGEALMGLTADPRVGEFLAQLRATLSSAGFLEDEVFERMRDERQRDFAGAPRRAAVHAGSAYPAAADPLREAMAQYMDGTAAGQADAVPAKGPAAGRLVGLAAPHVSPEGGWRSYRAAYAALHPADADRTFVILGTSHYGEPERFGLTRKPFLTPFGETAIDTDLVDELAEGGGPGVVLEDYCHSVEHSIEFQVVFLQHLYGPRVRIVPVLCGPFARSTAEPGRPEDDEGVRRFLGTLAEVAAREGGRVLWVLGVDMAHVGRRYGDGRSARVGDAAMGRVEARDRGRIDRIAAGSADGFWDLVQEKRDDLRWCGASPLYTFLHAVRPARGELLRYEQWNIDEHSVVSFAGMAFRERPGPS
jgi:AmmeMemoRadiSam system protein B